MLASTAHFWDTPRPRLYDDECTILNRTSSESSAEVSQELPLERLRARRRALLEELRDVDTQIRLLEDKTDQPP